MDKIKLGIAMPLDRTLVEMIGGVSPRLDVRELGALLLEEGRSPEAKAKLDEELRDVEVMFIGRPPANLIARAPKLKWAQAGGTGVDMFYDAGAMGGHYVVTNMTGTTALPMAEHCFMLMLMFMKHMPICLEQQRNHVYRNEPARPDFIEGKTLGVLGLGSIGQEVARLGKAFRMRVLGMRRSAQRQSNVGDVDELFPPSQLDEMLRECDFVVSTLPSTTETWHIIGEAEIRAMKPSACIVNVGRGKVIDEAALVRALKEGRIAGAGLDVFEKEPLPPESELWDMPNVFITPHVAGNLIDNRVRATRFFCANLERYVAGEPLRNVIDPAKEY